MNKKAFVENDLVLIYIENKPSLFARVEKIYADVKPNWWRVKLLVLQVPVFVTTWILDNDQIRGGDFTINGVPMRVELVKVPEEQVDPVKEQPASDTKKKKNARILSLSQNDD
ncbi:hypothetical protein B6D60_03740 [candidate division KSB1 bacterium 4484_87]|nr:MAG: hypothetical protein B6D60_03740 [candidate division KSB1 bacterium 4484_87]